MRKFIGTLIFVALASPAFANSDLPPLKYDVGTNAMSERDIQDAADKRAGVHLRYHRVQVGIGAAAALCDRLWAKRDGINFSSAFEKGSLCGCMIDDDIVYSYDTRARAKAKHRQYYPDMWNRFLRHEIGHRLGWADDHKGGRP